MKPAEAENKARLHVEVSGIVQGVGFRPFVYRLAKKFNLGGWVLNDSRGVVIEVEGDDRDLGSFVEELRASAPPLARIVQVKTSRAEPIGETSFRIVESVSREERTVLISPDVATCDDCLREMFDPDDRRFHYPFINCTNCGPRYTIIRDIPYDRPNTTMSKFKMCPLCEAEYHDPADRRFHAQPNACWDCGPRLILCDADGNEISTDAPIARVTEMLKEGLTVAIKGLGGFHLAVDATNDEAVRRLRARKKREQKPLAVMSKDIPTIRRYAFVNEVEERLLKSFQRPIVLLRKRQPNPIANSVAPRSRWFGVMLPYTPVHHLIMRGDFIALVMTSGNISEEPICFENEEAMERLRGIADAFLLNDRDIFMRTDDSVTRVQQSGQIILRRARGYVPVPVFLKDDGPAILATGPELKNTICLLRGKEAFLSQHIGDIKNFETLSYLEKTAEHLKRILQIEPEAIAHDMHPDYLSTRWAQEQKGLPLFAVQHHHAHIASCMAEHQLEEKVIGVAFDGTGYGTDGRIWGGEFLVCDLSGFERAGHFKYTPMPGGDAAVENPIRMAVAHLYQIWGKDTRDLELKALETISEAQLRVLFRMLEGRINCPLTSSVGRLFDSVSALLGICDYASYEGQPAIELEAFADEDCAEAYEWRIEEKDNLVVDSSVIIHQVVEDIQEGVPREMISARFHNAIAEVTAEVCRKIANKTGLRKVVLSGGVFQNMLISNKLQQLLTRSGLEVFQHSEVPPNDGGVSLGQAVVARNLLKKRQEGK